MGDYPSHLQQELSDTPSSVLPDSAGCHIRQPDRGHTDGLPGPTRQDGGLRYVRPNQW